MAKSKYQNLSLGIFIIVGLGIFAFGVYSIGDKQNLFGNTVKLYATFKDVKGLKQGNNVSYLGLNIGTVQQINLLSDTMIYVEMVIQTDKLKLIKKDAYAEIGTEGLVGNMVLSINPGSNGNRFLSENDTLRSVAKTGTDELMSSFYIVSKNIELITADLVEVTDQISTGSGIIHTLLYDKQSNTDLVNTLAKLKNTGDEANNVVKKMNQLLVSIDKSDNVIGMIRDTNIPLRFDEIISNFELSANKISETANSLNTTITSFSEGKGMVNYMFKDQNAVIKLDSSLNSFHKTIGNLNQASFKVNENLEALKHTYLLRGYFKKQEKERKKTE
jgi:phospholipid/cholesterol/gamma-HCH transport system substrate-binding protein